MCERYVRKRRTSRVEQRTKANKTTVKLKLSHYSKQTKMAFPCGLQYF